jgi:hypothetical protein
MIRGVARAAAVALVLFSTAPALADRPPDAARVKQAAEQFDAAVTSLKQRDFEGAASHFEAADAAVPSAQALRQAMKARQEAGQGARAATLAALALQRYPSDAGTAKIAHEVLDKFSSKLGRVNVSCASPCILAVGTRAIPGEASTRWTLYLDPGPASVSASFFGGSSAHKDIVAKPEAAANVRLEPEEGGAPAVAAVPAHKPSGDEPRDAPPDVPKTDDAAEKPSKGLPKIVFIGGLVATAALGGVTIWSGIDAKNNPGVDAVKAGCVGQGTSCALYQQGLSAQLRTNALIGATAGTAALTAVVGIFFTKWKSAPPPTESTALHVDPAPLVLDRGAGLGARGTF